MLRLLALLTAAVLSTAVAAAGERAGIDQELMSGDWTFSAQSIGSQPIALHVADIQWDVSESESGNAAVGFVFDPSSDEREKSHPLKFLRDIVSVASEFNVGKFHVTAKGDPLSGWHGMRFQAKVEPITITGKDDLSFLVAYTPGADRAERTPFAEQFKIAALFSWRF